MTITARYALVTGASRGIGRAVALALADHGVHVAINYVRNEAAAKATLDEIRLRGSDGFTVRADVGQPVEVARMFERVRDEFGGLDIFVSNARTEMETFYEPAMTLSLEKFDAAMDSQAKAFLVGVRQAASLMGVGGRVIAITYRPGGTFGGWQAWAGMAAAKSALEVLVRYFAVALAARGITVNAISPGWTDGGTGLNNLPDPVQQMIREHHRNGWTPMRRLGAPADIANAVALFCAREAAWITGQTVAADGGMGLMDAAVPLAIQMPELQPA